MNSRIDLAKYFNNMGFKKGAEIGVADGRYSEILCKEILNLKLYCIDLWKPYEDSWRTNTSQEKAFNKAKEKLKKYNIEFIKKSSLEASLMIEDRSLDFVFIDASHTFDNVMLDIILWTKKVKKKGIIALHDYCFFTNSGVVEAVNRYTEIHKIEIRLINRNKNNYKDDRQPVVYWENK